MADGWDKLRDEMVEKSRELLESSFIEAANYVKAEMAAEVAAMKFDYEIAIDPPTDDDEQKAGRLIIHGANPDLAEIVQARVVAKLGGKIT